MPALNATHWGGGSVTGLNAATDPPTRVLTGPRYQFSLEMIPAALPIPQSNPSPHAKPSFRARHLNVIFVVRNTRMP